MKLKQLLRNVILLITQPAMAWKFVSRMGNRAAMTSEFLYPMILLACLSTFLGIMLGSGFSGESIYPAIVRVVVMFFTFFCTYHLSSFLVSRLSLQYVGDEVDRTKTDLLTGYSMVVVLLLDLCLGLFPSFRIIGWIAQFYTVKIVWDGAAVLLRVPEERRLGYTMLVSLMIIFIPVVLGKGISLLSVNI
ncbi:MAG: DUF1282 family protein [Bacteroidaceae bacterium]|nr:DUF1282 family protein [Bacteroidaceae bacterium]